MADAAPAHSTKYQVPVPSVGTVELTVEERGAGRTFVLLHGGAGPVSWARFSPLLASRYPAHVLTPTHPGFARTARPEALKTVRGLAELYAAFLHELGDRDVVVIGNSVGGWIAAELALLAPPELGGIVLVGAGGIEVPGQTIPDISKLTLDQVMALSYHNPQPFRIDPTKMTDDQRAVIASNRAALTLYAPDSTDPSLKSRLANVRVPTLVLSGASDRVIPPEFGRAFASAIPGAEFQLLPDTGHVAQLETPALVYEAVAKFAPKPAG